MDALIIVEGNPEESAKVAEAFRTGTGLVAWKENHAGMLLRGDAVRLVSKEVSMSWKDRNVISECREILDEDGLQVFVEGAVGEDSDFNLKSVGSTECRELIGAARYLICFGKESQ